MIPSTLPRSPEAAARHRIGELVVGLDVLAAGEPAADHLLDQMVPLLHSVGAENIVAATHHVTTFDKSHVAMSISFTSGLGRTLALEILADALAVDDGAAGAVWTDGPGPEGVGTGLPSLRLSARTAATAHRDRSSGRVVHFPGIQNLTGAVPFRQIRDVGIDLLADELPPADTLLTVLKPLRPRWQNGQLVLRVRRAPGGVWAPVHES